MLGGMVLPVANWWYVWTARPEIHWMCPCVALVFVYGAMYLIYLACFSYIVSPVDLGRAHIASCADSRDRRPTRTRSTPPPR